MEHVDQSVNQSIKELIQRHKCDQPRSMTPRSKTQGHWQ